MRTWWIFTVLLTFAVTGSTLTGECSDARGNDTPLPQPALDGRVSVEKALTTRVTARGYGASPLTLAQVAQLLWAGNGNIPVDAVAAATKKVIPSARKTYPVELFLVCGEGTVQQIPAGVYHYDADKHALSRIAEGDLRKPVSSACNGQSWMTQAPIIVVIGSVFERAEATSGPARGVNFGVMESGNANQNILLQASALGLQTNTVGGIKDPELAAVLKLPANVKPVVLVTVGKK